jgi:hypothetical protein
VATDKIFTAAGGRRQCCDNDGLQAPLRPRRFADEVQQHHSVESLNMASPRIITKGLIFYRICHFIIVPLS